MRCLVRVDIASARCSFEEGGLCLFDESKVSALFVDPQSQEWTDLLHLVDSNHVQLTYTVHVTPR